MYLTVCGWFASDGGISWPLIGGGAVLWGRLWLISPVSVWVARLDNGCWLYVGVGSVGGCCCGGVVLVWGF